MKKRIAGIDVARSLAVIGMIIVNFKMVFGSNGSTILKMFAGLFSGKAAATFVVLAGVGIALMSKNAVMTHDVEKLKKIKFSVLKRAIFLFVIGLSYIPIWPADILHFYGIYMIILLLLLEKKDIFLWVSYFGLIILFPCLMMYLNYETGWNFEIFEYTDMWTMNGFFRNLFFNGFHPVIPWTAFMILGFWFGRQDLYDSRFVRKMLRISAALFIFIEIIRTVVQLILKQMNNTEIEMFFSTSPMPPFPLYMISGSCFAIAVISFCILYCEKNRDQHVVKLLTNTGQLALTFYVAHVIIGMGLVEILSSKRLGEYSIEFSLIYALLFSCVCVWFANWWKQRRTIGPLEQLMNRIIK